MQGKSAEGLPADLRASLAANEDFSGSLADIGTLTRKQSGWDPYDVWRTRVKNSSAMNEREADPRR
jgi:hypothetical protein